MLYSFCLGLPDQAGTEDQCLDLSIRCLGWGGQTPLMHRALLRSQPPPCKVGGRGREVVLELTLSWAIPILDTVAASSCAMSLLAGEWGLKGVATELGFVMEGGISL